MGLCGSAHDGKDSTITVDAKQDAAAAPAPASTAPRAPKPRALLNFRDSLPHENETAHEIVDLLFLGSWDAARDSETLAANGIVCVLNVARERGRMVKADAFEYLHIAVDDTERERLAPHFDAGVAFIDQSLRSGKPCLVHCTAGASRSASFVIAFLMTVRKMTLLEAYLHCKRRRYCVSPNAGFMEQLVELEQRLFGGAPTIAPLEYRSKRFEPPFWPESMKDVDMLSL